MSRPRPKRHATKSPTEIKVASDGETGRARHFATRTALDNIHVDLGRVAALADAAYHAFADLPRQATPEAQHAMRVVDAFVFSAWQAARDALQEADDAISELEGRSD